MKLSIDISKEELEERPAKYGKPFNEYTNEELLQILKMGRYQISYRTARNKSQWKIRKEQEAFWKKHHPSS